MIESIQVSGKTEEEAIEIALEQLGLERDDVSIEVVERAKSGFLGIGGSPAVIKVTYGSEDTQADQAAKFLKGLFEHMEVQAVPAIKEGAGEINITLTGENLGAVIGRRGETLDAIQHLTNYAVNRGASNRVRINVDAENYRERRNETLEQLAQKVAEKVLKYRRRVTLESMNSYERHVVHTTLQDVENITTYSIGTEPNRRVVVSYEGSPGADTSSRSTSREWS